MMQCKLCELLWHRSDCFIMIVDLLIFILQVCWQNPNTCKYVANTKRVRTILIRKHFGFCPDFPTVPSIHTPSPSCTLLGLLDQSWCILILWGSCNKALQGEGLHIHGRSGRSDYLSCKEKGSPAGKRDSEIGGKEQSLLWDLAWGQHQVVEIEDFLQRRKKQLNLAKTDWVFMLPLVLISLLSSQSFWCLKILFKSSSLVRAIMCALEN